jgi:hypothetical protein
MQGGALVGAKRLHLELVLLQVLWYLLFLIRSSSYQITNTSLILGVLAAHDHTHSSTSSKPQATCPARGATPTPRSCSSVFISPTPVVSKGWPRKQHCLPLRDSLTCVAPLISVME